MRVGGCMFNLRSATGFTRSARQIRCMPHPYFVENHREASINSTSPHRAVAFGEITKKLIHIPEDTHQTQQSLSFSVGSVESSLFNMLKADVVLLLVWMCRKGKSLKRGCKSDKVRVSTGLRGLHGMPESEQMVFFHLSLYCFGRYEEPDTQRNTVRGCHIRR